MRMPSWEDLHPEFRNTWHTRIEASLRLLADVEHQRSVWCDPSEPGDLEDLYHDIEDHCLADFVDFHQRWIQPELPSMLLLVEEELNHFVESLNKNDMWEVQSWINTPEWKRCINAGENALRIIDKTGWFTDRKQNI
jgi:hypothetical protein